MPARSPPRAGDPPHRTACVIGAGLGGLALAIRLQAGGIATTLIEARPAVGGIVRRVGGDAFRFEEGPSLLADPEPLRALWRLSGEDPEPALRLVPVDPQCRYLWSDGAAFDAAADRAGLARQFARLAPGEAEALDQWLDWASSALGDGWTGLAEADLDRPLDLLRAVPALWRGRAWQSAAGAAAGTVAEPHLRQALAFPALLSGGNPQHSPAVLLAGQPLAGLGPGWWPLGGMARLAETLAARFERLGGALRLHDPVVRLHTIGNRVGEVETQSGWRGHFAAVASNADVVHTWRELLRGAPGAALRALKLTERHFSPSALSVHFALAGTWPGIPHQSVLIGARFADLFADIFEHGVLPSDMMIRLHHPTVTDPELAEPGQSVLRATIPVANLGKLPIDWETVGPTIAERVLAEVGRRLIPDLTDRILARHVTTPRDLALDLDCHLGSGWSLEPRPGQAGPLRVAHRDRKLAGLYFAGAATHPGAGVAGVLAGAKAAAAAIEEDLK